MQLGQLPQVLLLGTLRRLWLNLLSRSTLDSGKLQLGCPLSRLQAEQTWSFQPFLIHHVLWTPGHFIGSAVDLLQFVNIFLVLRDHDWTKTGLYIPDVAS